MNAVLFSLSFTSIRTRKSLLSVSENPLGWGKEMCLLFHFLKIISKNQQPAEIVTFYLGTPIHRCHYSLSPASDSPAGSEIEEHTQEGFSPL